MAANTVAPGFGPTEVAQRYRGRAVPSLAYQVGEPGASVAGACLINRTTALSDRPVLLSLPPLVTAQNSGRSASLPPPVRSLAPCRCASQASSAAVGQNAGSVGLAQTAMSSPLVGLGAAHRDAQPAAGHGFHVPQAAAWCRTRAAAWAGRVRRSPSPPRAGRPAFSGGRPATPVRCGRLTIKDPGSALIARSRAGGAV